jgi:hypothetical protein
LPKMTLLTVLPRLRTNNPKGLGATLMTDVLTKLVNLWPAARLDELMPWASAKEHARHLAA